MSINKPIFATWMLSNNIGDALTPWLIEKVTGQMPLYVPFHVPYPKYMLTGSVLNHATDYTTVWGAGFANANDVITGSPDIRAARGPLTMQRVHVQSDIRVEVVGDPALLMPRFCDPRPLEPIGRSVAPPVMYKVGFIPHYIHQQETAAWLNDRDDIKLLNVFDDPEKFVWEMLQCEVVFSSSLHGLIIADAYGISSQWYEGTERLGGDGMKFHDHLIIRDYLSRFGPEQGFEQLMEFAWGRPCEPAGRVVKHHIQQLPKDVDALYAMVIENKAPDFSRVCEALWNACPFTQPQVPVKETPGVEPEPLRTPDVSPIDLSKPIPAEQDIEYIQPRGKAYDTIA